MIIDRYVDLLKVLEKKEHKQINITSELYQWLKSELGIQDNNTFYGIKLNVKDTKKEI